MKRLIKPNKENFLRLMLFVCSILIISYFIPREDKFSYNYSLGRPWSYSLLTAPFDIPINLDSVSISAQKDSINNAFVDIYKRDLSVEKSSVLGLYRELGKTKIPGQMRNHLVESVRTLYANGIVENDTYTKIAQGQLPEVRFIVDNVAELSSTGNMLSARVAYALIDSLYPAPEAQQAMDDIGITRYLAPNIVVDSVESKRLLDQLYQKALAPIGVMQKGERIIDRGDIVTPQAYELLKSYEKQMNDRAIDVKGKSYPLVGHIAIVTLLILSLYMFLLYFRWRILEDTRRFVFLIIFLVVFTVTAFAVITNVRSGVYLVPFAVLPVIVTTFYDSRTALFMHIVEVMLCMLVVTFPLEFVLLQFVAGVTAIVTVQELSKRSQLVQCAFYIFLAYSFSFTALTIMSEGNLDAINTHTFGYFGLNTVVFSFAYVLIFVIEKFFGFTSTVTLVELSDVNNPVLRELSEKCPGTFQHSLQVSNLAAEAAHNIGANVQLVRAGALYHDIGKIDNPAFFTENQRGENPHKTLSPELSAKIVIEHVANGVRRADKAKLPQVIKDFILQHHGCGKAKYFYTEACNASPDAEVDPQPYSYHGPNPQTKETSILMMADATEAASKSLVDHSDEAIRELVNRIVEAQIADGMYRESPVSFKDVEKIKRTFIDRLCTIYHVRVAYPDAVNKS